MRKLASMLLMLLIFAVPASATDLPEIEAEAYILIEEQSGQVLAGHNLDKVLYPASTTKILTALVAVEHGDLDAVVTVGAEINRVPADGSKVHLQIGDQLTLRDLLWGMMLRSGNDAAYTVAVHIARTAHDATLTIQQAIDVFAGMMNERAWEAGAGNSNFVVPDGYHHPQHYTTAYDLAVISRDALQHQLLRIMARAQEYVASYQSGGRQVTARWRNTNQLVQDESEWHYPQATGFKTGYTGEAEFCLVSSAADGGMSVLAVVLKGSREGRWHDSQALLTYGLENFCWHQVCESGAVVSEIPVANQGRDQAPSVQVAGARGRQMLLERSNLELIETELILNPDLLVDTEAGPALRAPLRHGQMVGRVVYTLDGEVLVDSPLVTTAAVGGLPWWERNLAWICIGGAALLWYLFYLPLVRRLNRRSRPVSR
ncbi:MAG: D-alanyl-D-alanine carboxypeptidase [Firmicutes bacterium]|nr:D-alanyl-D-alanine carboxypeptidase [Bacillota bacterium]